MTADERFDHHFGVCPGCHRNDGCVTLAAPPGFTAGDLQIFFMFGCGALETVFPTHFSTPYRSQSRGTCRHSSEARWSGTASNFLTELTQRCTVLPSRRIPRSWLPSITPLSKPRSRLRAPPARMGHFPRCGGSLGFRTGRHLAHADRTKPPYNRDTAPTPSRQHYPCMPHARIRRVDRHTPRLSKCSQGGIA